MSRINTRPTRRSLVAALGATAGALALAACSPGAPTAPPAKSGDAPAKAGATPAAAAPAKGGRQKIVFSAAGDAKTEQPVFRALADMFNKSEKYEVEVQPFPEGGWPKTLSVLASGDTPDAMRVEDDASYFVAKSGKLVDLTKYFEQDLYPKNDQYNSFLFQETHVDGKQFVVTVGHVPPLVFYNEDHFKEAGLTAPTKYQDAWSYETFLAAARKLGKRKGDFVERFAWHIENWDEAIPHSAGPGFFNNDQTKCNLDTPEVIDAIQSHVALVQNEKLVVPPGQNAVELFNSGQLSMMGTVAHQAQIISPDLKWKWMPYPRYKKNAMGSGYGRTFVVPTTGPNKNPDGAWEWYRTWLTPEGSTIIAKQPWGVPPHKKAEDTLLNDPRWKDKNIQLWIEALDHTFPRPMNPMRLSTIRNLYQNDAKLIEVLSGKLPPAQFLKEVAAEVNKEITQINWKYIPAPLSDKSPHNKSIYARWYYSGPARDDDPRKGF